MEYTLLVTFTSDEDEVAEAARAMIERMLPWMVDNLEVTYEEGI